MFKIDRNPLTDTGLHLPHPPFRVIGAADNRARLCKIAHPKPRFRMVRS